MANFGLLARFRYWLIRLLAGPDTIAINLWIQDGGIRVGSRKCYCHNLVIVGAKNGFISEDPGGAKQMLNVSKFVLLERIKKPEASNHGGIGDG